MDEDERCCGTGTCLINAQGVCWCGQVWNGKKMDAPAPAPAPPPPDADAAPKPRPPQPTGS